MGEARAPVRTGTGKPAQPFALSFLPSLHVVCLRADFAEIRKVGIGQLCSAWTDAYTIQRRITTASRASLLRGSIAQDPRRCDNNA